METFDVETRSHAEFREITSNVQQVVSGSGVNRGCAIVFIPHTTAGVTINEHADADVVVDMLDALDRAVPWNARYKHSEGNAAAHVKSSMLGHSATVIIEDGRLVLGTWQGIFFAEFDGPRRRKVHVQILEA